MKLHGNAALSLNGRRRLVRMVIEQGRSIATAGIAQYQVVHKADGIEITVVPRTHAPELELTAEITTRSPPR